MIERDLDLVCLGRVSVDLYGEQVGADLETASTFAKYVGGRPANIAIGTSRLGLRTGVISAVGDEAMGSFVRGALRDEHVDVSNLVTKAGCQTGLAIQGVSSPDHFPVVFYRANCADMALVEGDIDKTTVSRTRALLVTGTHCSTEAAFAVTERAVAMALASDVEVILDIDYQAGLWDVQDTSEGSDNDSGGKSAIRERLQKLLPQCRVVVGTTEEMCIVAGDDSIDDALAYLREATTAILLQRRGAEGCVCYPGDIDACIVGAPFPAEVLNALGGGDAFVSGFLAGYLRGMELDDCCRLANGSCAVVVARHGCAPAMPYWEELQTYLGQTGQAGQLDSLHRRMGRGPVDGRLHLLDFTSPDTETQHSSSERSQYLAISQSVLRRLKGNLRDVQLGVMVGSEQSEGHHSQWIGGLGRFVFQDVRCTDRSCCRFVGGQEAQAVVSSWPQSIGAKVTADLDADCNVERLVAHLGHLARACEATGRPLLIQFTADETPDRMQRIATAMQWCYRAGVYPDWWALPVDIEPIAWERVGTLIGEYDPYCHGVLLTGDVVEGVTLSTMLEKLYQTQKIVRGCIVGGSYWCDALAKGLTLYPSEEQLVAEVADRMQTLITGSEALALSE